MEALHWVAGKVFSADVMAFMPGYDAGGDVRSFYVGEDYNTGRWAAICPDGYRIGTFDTMDEAMVECEVWHAEKGWY